MKNLSNFKTIALAIAILLAQMTNAQIVLHDATNVTQTKAVLSAEFLDSGFVAKGFEYKFGTVPILDEFSKFVLSQDSEPVQITTTGKQWSARTVKGWVESNKELAAGESSSMTATVTFYNAGNVSFDWSVDSEENIGVLCFIVDGKVVSEISGLVDFKTYTRSIAAGEHTLEWRYEKKSATNVGLDLGMVRNIKFVNVTEGDWIEVQTDSDTYDLSNLYPGHEYIYRAYYTRKREGRLPSNVSRYISVYSQIETFSTLPVTLGEPEIVSTTQTTAQIKATADYGDAMVETGLVYKAAEPSPSEISNITDFEKAFFAEDTRGRGIQLIYEPSEWNIYDGYVMNKTINILSSIVAKVYILQETNVSFEWRRIDYRADAWFYVDGERKNTIEVTLTPGYHELKWVTRGDQYYDSYSGYESSYYGVGSVSIPGAMPSRNLWGDTTIEEAKAADDSTLVIVPCDTSFEHVAKGLKTNTKYYVQSYMLPLFDSELPKVWTETVSQPVSFTTKNVVAECDTIKDLKQASATICGKVDGGDATIVAAGLQYKDATGARWTTYEKGYATQELSHNVTRLRPGTSYHYRSYIQAEDCDTVFSAVGSFTTLAVEPIKPEIIRCSQHEVELQGKVMFGDANIYQRGMQFRKYNASSPEEWEDVEDGGSDSIFTFIRKDLEMGVTYEARTYVQAAGCDIQYSDIIKFTTLDYYVSKQWSRSTQTTVQLLALVVDVDEIAEIEYGFEYFISGDGFSYWDGYEFETSDTVSVKLTPVDGVISTRLENLFPDCVLEYRAFAIVNGEHISYSLNQWSIAHLKPALVDVAIKERTQTSVTLQIDAEQDSLWNGKIEADAVISQIEYMLGGGNIALGDYKICSNELEIDNLLPGRGYEIHFRGLSGGHYCPLLASESHDFSMFEFSTLPVEVSAEFSDITQTKATMKVNIMAGDAEVENFEYSINDGVDYMPCGETVILENLYPGTKYSIIFRGEIGGEIYYFYYYQQQIYEFSTLPVEVSAVFSNVTQTKATMEVNLIAGDATVTDFEYALDYSEYVPCTDIVKFENLTPGQWHYVGFRANVCGKWIYFNQYNQTESGFRTKDVTVSVTSVEEMQTALLFEQNNIYGDATYVSSGVEIVKDGTSIFPAGADGVVIVNELLPLETYSCRAYLETVEGGKVYSPYIDYTTTSIGCENSEVSNISNRSATMNGTIDCDSYSSAEFGFQWKQMSGWESEPAFTKGVKNDDGTISVALVNGMLEPNTDYQYRVAIRYLGKVYSASDWVTFRTELEYVYYPASVYTIFRTDRENNALVLCGYYVAGSESISSQGYEYWSTTRRTRSAGEVVTINTDESMQYSISLASLADGNYSVRAFVETASGDRIYGQTLSFGVSGGALLAVDEMETDNIECSVSGNVLSVHNAANQSCIIYNIQGAIIEERDTMSDTETFVLERKGLYIVSFGNGVVRKVRL